ncbi:GTP pyrophosphokinase [Bacillus phage pW2]|uniref:GTP pyrophosphokinase n=1 Tax=Bacillus phage pW2 TaxID=2500559 RepID=A0A3T0IHR1_9CAUD|nr:GTP pyrophosphokinase [Bacillus phage pW2]AZU98972.1 GTP pyrophosphokinase [Bacillus phage pW2]
MAVEARVIQLQKDLMELGYWDSLKALNWMLVTMNATNGYHRHDGTDYYMHLVDCAQDLLNHNIHDEITITACILHDSIEDVPDITYETVKSLFGEDVADVVLGVTKRDDINYKEDRVAFAEYLNEILKNWRKLLVKTADRKHNMSTLQDATPEKEYRQAVETEEYFLPLFKAGRDRYPEYARYLQTAKTTLYPHILKIKAHHEYRIMMEAKVKEQSHKIGLIMDMLQDSLLENENNDSFDDFVKLHNAVAQMLDE